MQYAQFGNTGIEVSKLGFGAMRLPEYEQKGRWLVREDESIDLIHHAFELGVNYIDTAYDYCHGNSEIIIGKALKGYRNQINVSTKLLTKMVTTEGDFRRILEHQMEKLDIDFIDFYYFHALNKERWENIVLKFNLLSQAQYAKEEGLIKHISFSSHDKPDNIMEFFKAGIFETVILQYNIVDRRNENLIRQLKEEGIGVAIMGPIGGGRLAMPSPIISQYTKEVTHNNIELALRFVLANPGVSCALSGMSTMNMVEENVRTASIQQPFFDSDWDKVNHLFAEVRRLTDLYCTGCNYCMPCPKGINIPFIFELMIQDQVYGYRDYAQKKFKVIKDNKVSSFPIECIECGQCESKCPQNIPIREQLKQVQANFD